MDLTTTRHADGLSVVRLQSAAAACEPNSHLTAAIMRATAAIADGEPAEAGRLVIAAISSIDGTAIDAALAEHARLAMAPVLRSVEDVHTCQACIIRSLCQMIDRLEMGVRPDRIGEILGGLHVHLAQMTRARAELPLAA